MFFFILFSTRKHKGDITRGFTNPNYAGGSMTSENEVHKIFISHYSALALSHGKAEQQSSRSYLFLVKGRILMCLCIIVYPMNIQMHNDYMGVYFQIQYIC